MLKKVIIGCLSFTLLTGCSQVVVPQSQSEITNQIGTTLHYRVNPDALAQYEGDPTEGMLDAIKSLIDQRLAKKYQQGFKVTSGLLDSNLITVKVSANDPLTFAEANGLIAPLPLSIKELPSTADLAQEPIWQETGLTEQQLDRVGIGAVQQSYHIALTLNKEGQAKIAEITKRNIGKPLAIFLGDVLISQPMVQSEITGNELMIVTESSVSEQLLLLNSLRLAVYKKPVAALLSITN
jgi:preprotein translocase subunit SecD